MTSPYVGAAPVSVFWSALAVVVGVLLIAREIGLQLAARRRRRGHQTTEGL